MMTFFKTKIRNYIQNITCYRKEDEKIIQFLQLLKLKPDSCVLDVGCGFGSKMRLLRSYGINVIGVDVNSDIVKSNINNGLSCMTADDFRDSEMVFDVILLSHVIEHLAPRDLVSFLDFYLDRLKLDGHLIIATPLFTPHFYEDFDHVKPYHPTSIQMVFGIEAGQVQYISKNKIQRIDVWIRRQPFKLIFTPYCKNNLYIPDVINILLAIAYRTTLGLLGRNTGWVGLYCKVSNLNGDR